MEQLANVTVSQCHIIKIITSSLNFTDKTELLDYGKSQDKTKWAMCYSMIVQEMACFYTEIR